MKGVPARRAMTCIVCHQPIHGTEAYLRHRRLQVEIHTGCPLTSVQGEDVSQDAMQLVGAAPQRVHRGQ